MSMHEEQAFVNAARRSGANGYFPKTNDPGQFVPWLLNLVASPDNPTQQLMGEKAPLLSRQEQLILRHIAQGKTSQEIADALSISPLTVKTHRKNILRKLQASNAAELIRIATNRGLL